MKHYQLIALLNVERIKLKLENSDRSAAGKDTNATKKAYADLLRLIDKAEADYKNIHQFSPRDPV